MVQNESNIRESYRCFPNCAQNFFTWLTGKALPEQKPLFILSKWLHFFVPFGMFLGGVVGNLYLAPQLGAYSWLLRLIFWIITIIGIRYLVLTIRHECAHNNFVANTRVNKILGEFITIVLLIRTTKAYRHDHVSLHHNSNLLCTAQDPHIIYLSEYGITYGISKNKLWTRLILILLSPSFYIGMTYRRVKANVAAQNITRRTGAFIYLAIWGSIISFSSLSIYDFIMAYAFPVFILSEASAFIEVISEHPAAPKVDGVPKTPNERRLMLASKSWCILSGSPIPDKSDSMLVNICRTSVWCIKMIGHLLIRLTVLPGPLPSHELHHRKPGQYDWRIAFYERQRDIDAGHPEYPPYTEIWGLFAALDQVFEGMSKRAPLW